MKNNQSIIPIKYTTGIAIVSDPDELLQEVKLGERLY